MVLVPEHLVQAWFEDGISECPTHAVVCVQESATRPTPRSYFAFRTFEVLFCFYDHRTSPPPVFAGKATPNVGIVPRIRDASTDLVVLSGSATPLEHSVRLQVNVFEDTSSSAPKARNVIAWAVGPGATRLRPS